MRDGDLHKIIANLRQHGIEVDIGKIDTRQGIQVGLYINRDFFPDWELGTLDNRISTSTLDFAAIKARRPPHFEFCEPALWRKRP